MKRLGIGALRLIGAGFMLGIALSLLAVGFDLIGRHSTADNLLRIGAPLVFVPGVLALVSLCLLGVVAALFGGGDDESGEGDQTEPKP